MAKSMVFAVAWQSRYLSRTVLLTDPSAERLRSAVTAEVPLLSAVCVFSPPDEPVVAEPVVPCAEAEFAPDVAPVCACRPAVVDCRPACVTPVISASEVPWVADARFPPVTVGPGVCGALPVVPRAEAESAPDVAPAPPLGRVCVSFAEAAPVCLLAIAWQLASSSTPVYVCPAAGAVVVCPIRAIPPANSSEAIFFIRNLPKVGL
jgi:hypothetical protein